MVLSQLNAGTDGGTGQDMVWRRWGSWLGKWITALGPINAFAQISYIILPKITKRSGQICRLVCPFP